MALGRLVPGPCCQSHLQQVVARCGWWLYGAGMATTLTCGDICVHGSDVHVCVAPVGHQRVGLTHISADGHEWYDASIDSTYLSDPSHEMALAS